MNARKSAWKVRGELPSPAHSGAMAVVLFVFGLFDPGMGLGANPATVAGETKPPVTKRDGNWAAATLEGQLQTAGENAGEIKGFLRTAGERYGDFGERAAVFLVAGMPERDLRMLKNSFLLENLDLALQARTEFDWARNLPEEVFLNDVLPYACLDEAREMWRREYYEMCRDLVKECRTTSEAAQVINRELFKVIHVHYNTGRKAPNQSPSESRKLGMATCTGLAIILVDACRSVGVPARVAGIASWPEKRGNHTWVEIYDRGEWFFTGADEYNKNGLNKGWFAGDAARAIAEDWKHAIWATSWKKADGNFPMVWNLQDKSVPAVNVTGRYAKMEPKRDGKATVHLRIWDKAGGVRLALPVEVLDGFGKMVQTVTTKAGTADLNDMASVELKTGESYWLRIVKDGEARVRELRLGGTESVTKDLVWDELVQKSVGLEAVKGWLALLPEERHLSVPECALSRQEAAESRDLIWETLRRELAGLRKEEVEAGVVRADGKEMKYLEKSFGTARDGERSLWISMHGGGGAPARVNDRQWTNQIRLYAPAEGIVVAPRAPTDTWDLWHQGHIDSLFDRLIANFVTVRGVNPDRVYLLGYSAGGDGVYQLAPRMADRFAAASMMAGHPNDANPLGLRNLPFFVFVGGDDGAYNRNKVAAEWGAKLEALRQRDGKGYAHKVVVYEGLGHWMSGRDQEALPWMAEHTRNAWPGKVVWHQSRRTHNRFYWLAVPPGSARGGQTVRAEVTGQQITIDAQGVDQLILRLSDALVDMNQPVCVSVNGEKKFEGKVERTVRAIWDSLNARADPRTAASGLITLSF